MAKKASSNKVSNSIKNAVKSIKTYTNADFWDLARRYSPSFASHTADATKQQFNLKGFEALTDIDGLTTINEFFSISMRVAFQLLNVSRAKNPLVDKGLVQIYDTPNGGFVQRMAVHSIKPVDPKFKNLKDGDSVDPFVVRKPNVDERFFSMNFDYQNLITVQEYQLKTMFINEYGMGELLAGILEGMANGYTIQEYVNTKECIGSAIASDSFPLKDTQKVTLPNGWNSKPSESQMKDLILALKDTATRMSVVPQTGMYNALGFESVVDPEEHVLLLRAGVRNAINTGLMVGAFNPEFLTLPFEIIEVDNFGGLTPEDEDGNELPTVYGPLGDAVGFFDTSAEKYETYELHGVTYELDSWLNDEIPFQRNGKWYMSAKYVYDTTTIKVDIPIPAEPDHYYDPYEDVLAVIIQKGAIFETAQNPYQVTPIFNPRGLYTNYIASRPNTGIHYDALYNLIVFYGTTKDLSEAININIEKIGGQPVIDEGEVYTTLPVTVNNAEAIPVEVDNAEAISVVVGNTAESPVLTQEVTPTP